MTPSLQTLPAGSEHSEDVDAPDSVAGRLIRLWNQTSKAWAVVVDAGPQYDRFAPSLESAGIPTFRSADRALAVLERYCAWKLDRS